MSGKAASGGGVAAGGGGRRHAAAGSGERRRQVAGAAGNAKALVSAKLAQETRLLQAWNALRVCPAETLLTVYRRLHIVDFTSSDLNAF